MSDQENRSAFVYEKDKSWCGELMKGMFSHVGLILMVGLYAAFGAWAFVQLESPAENERFLAKKQAAIDIEGDINYTVNLLWFYGDEQKFNWTYANYSEKVNESLTALEESILDAVQNKKYDGKEDTWNYDWSFLNALLLTMTIITTIGYGHIAPMTFEGQMFCIFYSLVGCALFLVFLANLGDVMAKGFTFCYSRCVCRWFRGRRHKEEVPSGVSKRYAKLVMDDPVGEEEYMPTSELFVPITVNVFVLHAYMLLGAAVFSAWEGWSLVSSFYFTFVTLSTIGYGDLVPGNALLEGDSLSSQMQMLFSVCYIVFGMALLSMCINLMQQQIVQKIKWAGKQMGFIKPSPDEVKADAIRKQSLMPKSAGKSPYRQPNPNNDSLPGTPRKELLPGSWD